jgi:hypothetical protein
MSASEKAAWFQLTLCLAAVVVVASLFPRMGHSATAGFALLALIILSAGFYWQSGDRVRVDERDREIEKRTTRIAVGTTWLGLIAILAIAGMWSSYWETHSISARFLNWLIWGQFVVYFSIKAITSVILYRSQRNAA